MDYDICRILRTGTKLSEKWYYRHPVIIRDKLQSF